MNKPNKSTLTFILVGIAIAAAALAWWLLRSPGLPKGIVASNGRIEATEIDIATKTPGRIVDIMAREGDFVQAGQVLARMDTQVLLAQKAEAQAQVRQAENAYLAAQSGSSSS